MKVGIHKNRAELRLKLRGLELRSPAGMAARVCLRACSGRLSRRAAPAWRCCSSSSTSPPADADDPVAAARAAVAARKPLAEKADPSRTIYRRSRESETWRDWLYGRYQSVPVDLNHDFEMWAEKEKVTRHLSTLLATFRSQTYHRLRFSLTGMVGASSAVVGHNSEWSPPHCLIATGSV